MTNPSITIFTPTYNRAGHLQRLYHSLKKQTYRSFEWVIVDDGSDDHTAAVVKEFIDERIMPISYHCQRNAGKHIAINNGVQTATGTLFYIVDSDDILPHRALEIIWKEWSIVLKKSDRHLYAGVCGLKAYEKGEIVGGKVDYDILEMTSIDYRFKSGYQGDRAEVYRTDVLLQYPFPVIAGENFCTEGLVWNRIGKSYKLRFFNEVVYLCEYLPGGLSAKSVALRKANPQYACLYYAELVNAVDLNFSRRVRGIMNFWRFAAHNHKESLSTKIKQIKNPWFLPFLPVCYLTFYIVEKLDHRK